LKNEKILKILRTVKANRNRQGKEKRRNISREKPKREIS
jgi:hypothetical protein